MPSAVIETYEYNAGSETLTIRFRSGKVYNYIGVPAKVYEDMRVTPYKGKFLNDYIKGKYTFVQIYDPE